MKSRDDQTAIRVTAQLSLQQGFVKIISVPGIMDMIVLQNFTAQKPEPICARIRIVVGKIHAPAMIVQRKTNVLVNTLLPVGRV
ncbi:MAG: hypothetical protein HQM10_13690 [Candidatus Riflebacteria bacterium]|nr:hypothetical protein [Candidatus Riflebacteria bacterium]